METTRLVTMNRIKIMKRYVKTLNDAEKLASENRDVEALVAISDRWYALMESLDEEDKKIIVGFTGKEKHDDDAKRHDKRKS